MKKNIILLACVISFNIKFTNAQLLWLYSNSYFWSVNDKTKFHYTDTRYCKDSTVAQNYYTDVFPKYNLKSYYNDSYLNFLEYKEKIIYTDSIRPCFYNYTFFELFNDSILFITFFDNKEIFNNPETIHRYDCFIIKYQNPETIYQVNFSGKKIEPSYDILLLSNTDNFSVKKIDLEKLSVILQSKEKDVYDFRLRKFKNPYIK